MPFPTSHPALDRALSERGYAEPTPVQAQVLEASEDRDLLVSAQTGSGKTVAFGLALAPTLLGLSERFGEAGAPAALVIAPTRELALQVNAELTWLYAGAGATILSCVGGMDPRAERAPCRGAATSSSAPRGVCAITLSAGRWTSRPCGPWCSTRPTRCWTWASRRT